MSAPRACGASSRRRLSTSACFARRSPLGVAVMDRERVAVRVREERLQADARVERLALELDAARAQLLLGALEVVHVERDRMVVGLGFKPERIRLHDGDREAAGLELDARHPAPALQLRQAERLTVE